MDEELLTRLESFLRDNNTLRELELQSYRSKSPVPANVAAALLKGAVHNKVLEMMRIGVPNTVELHKLENEVKLVNKNLKLIVEFCKVSVFNIIVFVCQCSKQFKNEIHVDYSLTIL